MTPADTEAQAGPISVLNVGTKILLRDVMDQYLRTLGDIRTYYASNMKSALRFIGEHNIHVLICEVFLEDGSAERLLKALGPRSIQDELWVVLALESKSEDVVALALELGANSVLIKPFAANDLKTQIEKYKARRASPSADKSVELIKEGETAMRERRTFDADKKYKEASVAAPQNHIVQTHCAQYLLAKPDYGLAEQCLKRALEVKPGHVPALSLYGRLELERGNLEAAYKYLSAAHKVSPLNAERSLLLAKYYAQKAAETVNTVTQSDEQHPLARLELGKLLVHQKDFVGGLIQLERCYAGLEGDAQKECITYQALARKLGNIRKD